MIKTFPKWLLPTILALSSIILLCLQFAFPILETFGSMNVEGKKLKQVSLITFQLYGGFAHCYFKSVSTDSPVYFAQIQDERDSESWLKGSFEQFHKFKNGDFPYTETMLREKAYEDLKSTAGKTEVDAYLWDMQEYKDLVAMEVMDDYGFSGIDVGYFFKKSLILSSVALTLFVLGTIPMIAIFRSGKGNNTSYANDYCNGTNERPKRQILFQVLAFLSFGTATALLGILIVALMIQEAPLIRQDLIKGRTIQLTDSWNYHYLMFSFSCGCLLSGTIASRITSNLFQEKK